MPKKLPQEIAKIRAELIRTARFHRMSNKVNQRKIAERMGTTQSAVSDLERFITVPRDSTLVRYVTACGLQIPDELATVMGIVREGDDDDAY